MLLPNSRVEAGARVRRTILNEEATIAGGALVGDGESITVVGAGATMRVEE